MSALGQKQTCAVQNVMSALCHKRKCVATLVPASDREQAQKRSGAELLRPDFFNNSNGDSNDGALRLTAIATVYF